MNKEKVKEFLSKARMYILAYQHTRKDADLAKAFLNLCNVERAIDESDWVSVEDSLPDYEEDVLVTSEDTPSKIWFAHRTKRDEVVKDCHGFAKCGNGIKITHWQRVIPLKKK